jgi:hypothetical protein
MGKLLIASTGYDAAIDNTVAGAVVRPSGWAVNDYQTVAVQAPSTSGYYIPYVDVYFSVGISGASPTYNLVIIEDSQSLPVPQQGSASAIGLNNVTNPPLASAGPYTSRYNGIFSGTITNQPLTLGAYGRLTGANGTPIYVNSRRIYFACYVATTGTAFLGATKVVFTFPFVSIHD